MNIILRIPNSMYNIIFVDEPSSLELPEEYNKKQPMMVLPKIPFKKKIVKKMPLNFPTASGCLMC